MTDKTNMLGITLSADDLRQFPRLTATFIPMQWVDHENKGFRAEMVQDGTPVAFDVTLDVLYVGRVYSRDILSMGQRKIETHSFTKKVYNSPFLQNASAAPPWLRQWLGPTKFHLNLDIRTFWRTVDSWLEQKLDWDPEGRMLRPEIPGEVWRYLQNQQQKSKNGITTLPKRPIDLAGLGKEHSIAIAVLNDIACLSAAGFVMSYEAAGKIAIEAARKAISEIVRARDASEPLPPAPQP